MDFELIFFIASFVVVIISFFIKALEEDRTKVIKNDIVLKKEQYRNKIIDDTAEEYFEPIDVTDEEEFQYYNKDTDWKTYGEKATIKIPDTDYMVYYNNHGEWISMFNKNGTRYAFVLQPYNAPDELIGTFGCIKWAKDEKPKDYKKVESFFANEKFTLPYALTENEISKIKKIVYDYYSSQIKKIDIDKNTMFANTPETLHYDVVVDYKDSFSGEYFYLDVSKTSISSFTSSSVEREPPIYLIREEYDLKIAKRKKFDIIKRAFEEKKKREDDLRKWEKERIEEEKIKKDIRINYFRTNYALELIDAPFNVTTFYKLMLSRKYVEKYKNTYMPINDGKKYAKLYGVFYLKKDTLDELLKILIKDYELPKKKQLHKTHFDINGNIIKCPQCNSSHLNKKGKRKLQNKLMQRYQCQSCNHMFAIPLDELILS